LAETHKFIILFQIYYYFLYRTCHYVILQQQSLTFFDNLVAD